MYLIGFSITIHVFEVQANVSQKQYFSNSYICVNYGNNIVTSFNLNVKPQIKNKFYRLNNYNLKNLIIIIYKD